MSHDLNLAVYSLSDILALFGIAPEKVHGDLDAADMKAAKHIAAMTHPDKSGLGSEYFLFYREAFSTLTSLYRAQNRQNVSREERLAKKEYAPDNTKAKAAGTVAGGMTAVEFNGKFNDLFDRHVGAAEHDRRERESLRDCWRSDSAAATPAAAAAKSAKASAATSLSTVRAGEFQASLFRSGTFELYADDADQGAHRDQNSGDDDGDGDAALQRTSRRGYVSSDMFNSKLKFDDLRRVHRDHTVLDVPQAAALDDDCASLDDARRARDADAMGWHAAPMDKSVAEGILDVRERAFRAKMVQRSYNDQVRTKQFEKTNKAVLASFLQIADL